MSSKLPATPAVFEDVTVEIPLMSALSCTAQQDFGQDQSMQAALTMVPQKHAGIVQSSHRNVADHQKAWTGVCGY